MSKDKGRLVTSEELTRHCTDWIEYRTADFNFEHKRGIIRVKKDDSRGDAVTRSEEKTVKNSLGASAFLRENDETAWEEVWTGDYIFENERQSFRTKKGRPLELKKNNCIIAFLGRPRRTEKNLTFPPIKYIRYAYTLHKMEVKRS